MGVIAEDPARGITEIARPVGVVAAITPSTNPGATPANNVVCALKGGNAIVARAVTQGRSTGARLVDYIGAELAARGRAADLVQILPAPVTRDATQALMAAADLVVATGSQANVRAAYRSGTPAFGVGAGNVAVDRRRERRCRRRGREDRARRRRSTTRRAARRRTASSRSTRSRRRLRAALEREGGVFLDAEEKARLREAMWRDGRLAPEITAQCAPRIAAIAGLVRPALQSARFLDRRRAGVGPAHPFSGEKLSPVLAFYQVGDFAAACALVERVYAYQGAGHSVGIHTRMTSARR